MNIVRFAGLICVWAFAAGTAVHAQTSVEQVQASQPIPGTDNWVLQQRLPGIEQRVCTVRAEGPDANTTLLLNNNGLPVLILGRHDWSGLRGETQVSLSIDGEVPVTASAGMAGNLVLVLLSDELLPRLRGARTLDWTLSFGRFRADVTGLGTALDALRRCVPDPQT